MKRKFLQNEFIKVAQDSCGIFGADALKVITDAARANGIQIDQINALKSSICKAASTIPQAQQELLTKYDIVNQIVGESLKNLTDFSQISKWVDTFSSTVSQLQGISTAASILNIDYEKIIQYAAANKLINQNILPKSWDDATGLALAQHNLGSVLMSAATTWELIPGGSDELERENVYKFVIDSYILLGDTEVIKNVLDIIKGIDKSLSNLNIFTALDSAVKLRGVGDLIFILSYLDAVFSSKESESLLTAINMILRPIENSTALQIKTEGFKVHVDEATQSAADIILKNRQFKVLYQNALVNATQYLSTKDQYSETIQSNIAQWEGTIFRLNWANEFKKIFDANAPTVKKSSTNQKIITSQVPPQNNPPSSLSKFIDLFKQTYTDAGAQQIFQAKDKIADMDKVLKTLALRSDLQEAIRDSMNSAQAAGMTLLPSTTLNKSYQDFEDVMISSIASLITSEGNPQVRGMTIAQYKLFLDNLFITNKDQTLNRFWNSLINNETFKLDFSLPKDLPFTPEKQKIETQEATEIAEFEKIFSSYNMQYNFFVKERSNFEELMNDVKPSAKNNNYFSDTDITYVGQLEDLLDEMLKQSAIVVDEFQSALKKAVSTNKSVNLPSATKKIYVSSLAIKIIKMMRQLEECIKEYIVLVPDVKIKGFEAKYQMYKSYALYLEELNPYLANPMGVAIANAGNMIIRTLQDFQQNLTDNLFFKTYLSVLEKIDGMNIINDLIVKYGNSKDNTSQIRSDLSNFINTTQYKIQTLITDKNREIAQMAKKTGLIKR